MKLGEALSKLKREKSRLARLILLRKENVFVEEGKTTAFDPQKLSLEIEEKIKEIRLLKVKIQEANLKTMMEEEKLSLAEAIIKVNDLRSQIAHLTTLFEDKKSWYIRDKEEKETHAQIDKRLVEEEIEKLEREKVQLDNKIQITNWSTNLND